jgi:tetratricopeptide (TPR) repeat protein
MELGLVGDTYITYNNLIWALNNEDPSAALELADEALSVLRAHGLAEGEALTQAYRLETWFLLGRWEELIAEADAIIEWAEGSTSWHIKLIAAIPKAWALSLRGDRSEAGRFADDICEGKEDRWLSALAIPRVQARRAAGREADAAKLLHETIEDLERHGTPLLEFLCDIARETIALGRLDLLSRCGALSAGNVKGAQHGRQTWQGLSAEADERFGEALARFADAELGWATFGNPFERAQALLGQARCLVALGRPAEAAVHLHRAHETFAVLGARPALEETDSLLQRTTVVSA